MTAVFHRSSRSTLPTAASGHDCYLMDANGKRYLDACGGAAVSCLGHPMATAAANAVLSQITEPDMMAQVRQRGDELQKSLRAKYNDHPYIGDIRGRGLFRGLEFVANRGTKSPFVPARAINKKIKAAAMAEGLMCYPIGGTVDWKQGDHVLLAPPFIIEEAQLDEQTYKLSIAIETALAQ